MKNQERSDTDEIKETNFIDDEFGEVDEETLSDNLSFGDTKDTPQKVDASTKLGVNKTKKIQVEVDNTPQKATAPVDSERWFGKEGELAIDVYQTDTEIVIQAAIAGVKAEDLDIQIENDVVTIRGTRNNPNEKDEKEYFHEECFWGPFSRQVFLPEEINTKNVEAAMKEGVFSLRLPKMNREQTKKVKISKK